MNYINYKTLHLDFLRDITVVLPLDIRNQLIKKLHRASSEHLSTKRIASINEVIEKHIKRNKQLDTFRFVNNNYDKDHIKDILSYQIEYDMTHTEVCTQFKLSRTTLARWKKIFGE